MTSAALGTGSGAPPLPRVAAGAAVASGVCLVVLHVVRPALDPAWSVVSQYAVGAHGWLMAGTFLLLAAACACLAVALTSARLHRAGRIGRVLLAVAAAGLVVAALFPVGTALHEVGSLLGNVGLALGAVLVGRDLRRALHPLARRWSAAAAHAPWVLAVVMAALISTNTWGVGLANRAVVVAYIVWLALAAHQLRTSIPERGAARRE